MSDGTGGNFRGPLTGNRNLAYAAIHPFPLPGWQPSDLVCITGKNWQVIFQPNGADYIDIERGPKIIDRHLEGPNILIRGTNGVSDRDEVVRAQKPLIDAVRGLLFLLGPPAKPVLLPPVWEGVLRIPSPKTIAYEVGRREATWPGLTRAQLEDWGKEWEAFDPLECPPEVGFALRWFYQGMLELADLSGEPADAFTALWLCIITLVRAWHSQNVGGDPSEMQRFIAYAGTRLQLQGDVLEDVKKEFQQVRHRRNELFKGGGGMAVSEKEASLAANLAHHVLRYELGLYSQGKAKFKSS